MKHFTIKYTDEQMKEFLSWVEENQYFDNIKFANRASIGYNKTLCDVYCSNDLALIVKMVWNELIVCGGKNVG